MTKPNRHQIVYRRGQASKDLASIINQYDVCTVVIEEGEPKKRSVDANALQHTWYPEISKYTSHSIKDITAYCKMNFGFPILRYDVKTEQEKVHAYMINCTFKSVDYDAIDMPLERRLKIALKTPCTRLMTPRQHKLFLEQLQMHYAPGLILESNK